MADEISLEGVVNNHTVPEIDRLTDEVISIAESKVLKFSDSPVYERINLMDKKGEITIEFPFISPSGQRAAEFIGTTHNHNLSDEEVEKQKDFLLKKFNAYLGVQKENGTKPMLMIEGGKVMEYTSYEEVAADPGEFAHLVWAAQQEGIPIYSPDTTAGDTTELMENAGYPQETIAFLECFKTMHVKVREKLSNKEEVTFSQFELVNLLAGVAERTHWNEKLEQISSLKTNYEKLSDGHPDLRSEMDSFIHSVLDGLNKQFQESTKSIDNADGFPLFQISGVDEKGDPTYTSLYDPEDHYQSLLRPDTFAEDNLKTPMNELSNKLGDLREQIVFRRIAEKIKDGYNPFIVFGNSHAIKQAPAIEYIYKNLK